MEATWDAQLRATRQDNIGYQQDEELQMRRDNRFKMMFSNSDKRQVKTKRLELKRVGGIDKISKSLNNQNNGAKQATNKMLAFSWLNLIPSFGLTMFYINMHVFMHMLFPSIFGKLGEEWIPQSLKVAGVDPSSKPIGFVEKIVWGIVNLVILVGILLFVVIIMALLDAVFGILGFIFDWFGFGFVDSWNITVTK